MASTVAEATRSSSLRRTSSAAFAAARRFGALRRVSRDRVARAGAAAEEGDQPVDGRCVLGGGLGRAESARARLCRELNSGESQRLLGQVLREHSRLAGCLSEIPAVGQQIVETNLQKLFARGSPQGAPEAAFENPGLIEHSLQRGPGSAVGACRVISKMIETALERGPPQ
jgi:hypothetical protein